MKKMVKRKDLMVEERNAVDEIKVDNPIYYETDEEGDEMSWSSYPSEDFDGIVLIFLLYLIVTSNGVNIYYFYLLAARIAKVQAEEEAKGK